MTVLYMLCLFLSVWQGLIFLTRLVRGLQITWFTFGSLALGLTGLLAHIAGFW